jgi:Zn-dependent protease
MQAGLWLRVQYPDAGSVLVYTGAAGVFINSAVMMVNLLPIPPLDGGRILVSLLPETIGRRLASLEPFGLPVLLLLILTGLLSRLLWPLMVVGMATATWLAAIPVDVLTGALRALLG